MLFFEIVPDFLFFVFQVFSLFHTQWALQHLLWHVSHALIAVHCSFPPPLASILLHTATFILFAENHREFVTQFGRIFNTAFSVGRSSAKENGQKPAARVPSFWRTVQIGGPGL